MNYKNFFVRYRAVNFIETNESKINHCLKIIEMCRRAPFFCSRYTFASLEKKKKKQQNRRKKNIQTNTNKSIA